MSSNIDVTVILPFLNEESSLESTADKLNSYFEKVDLKGEVIFVDDGSSDKSFDIISKRKYTGFRAKVIKLSKNFGTHAALRAGISKAEGSYITFMYADLQDPLELIEQLYLKCKEGSDIAWAVRKNIDTGVFNRLFTKLYAFLIKKFVSSEFPDNGMDIVMFSSKIGDILNKKVESNSSVFLQIFTMGFKHSFITYDKVERTAGKSKWTMSKKIKLLIDSFVAFSYIPIRLVSMIGIVLALMGLIWGGVIILRAILWDDLVAGWPTLIAVLMIGFGITNISLGIIAEYLWRTLDTARGRDVFIIDNYIEIN